MFEKGKNARILPIRRIHLESVIFLPAITKIPGDDTVIPNDDLLRKLQSDLKTFASETRKRLDEIGKRIAVSQQEVLIGLSSDKHSTEPELAEHTKNRSNNIAEDPRSACSIAKPVKHDSDYQLDAIKRRLAERLRNTSSET